MRHSDEPLRLQIHDDGSLTDADCEQLSESLQQSRVVRRGEADAWLAEFLRAYPALRQFRDRLVLALKLIDTVVLHPDERYLFCDADVLFVRPFRLPGLDASQMVLMPDRKPAYSLRSWNLMLAHTVALPRTANTGFVMARKNRIDWDYLEWFVDQRRHYNIGPMLEQTAWAALGMRLGCRLLDDDQVRVMREGENNERLVAGHFTAKTRHLLPSFVQRAAGGQTLEPTLLRTKAPGECRAIDLARYEVRRLVGRLTGTSFEQ